MTLDVLLQGLLAGLFATFVMDLSFAAGKVGGFIGAPFPLPLGRWAGYLARGRAVHDTILEARPLAGEGPATLLAHYTIGATLGMVFVTVSPQVFPARPFLGGVTFGTATSLLPWLVMFPAMGFGLFGMKGPRQGHMLRNSLYTHVAFGVGLGVWALWRM